MNVIVLTTIIKTKIKHANGRQHLNASFLFPRFTLKNDLFHSILIGLADKYLKGCLIGMKFYMAENTFCLHTRNSADLPINNFLQKFSYIVRLHNFFTLRWRECSCFILDIGILWSWPAK